MFAEARPTEKVLGDFRLIKQIGHGSLGTAFVAEHRFTKRPCVLKVFPEELSSDRTFLSRFEEEIAHLAAIDHPHIVKVHTVSSAQGLYFLVVDCVVDAVGETTNLAEYFKASGEPLPEAHITVILEQVADALDWGHSLSDPAGAPLKHLGLKLNNILVAAGSRGMPRVLVSDWGLSRIVGVGACLTRTFKGMIDGLGIAKITHDRYVSPPVEAAKLSPLHQTLIQNFAFLAPEQKRGDVSCDEKADIYAYGVLCYYLLMGEYPEGYFPLPSSRHARTDIDWDLVVKECLRPHPEKRPHLLRTLLHEARNEVAVPVQVREREIREYHPDLSRDSAIQPILSETVVIEGGTYVRGSAMGCRDEMPRHGVIVNTFAIDIHPITNEQFVRFLEWMGGEKDTHNHDIIRLRDSRIKKSSGRYSIEAGYAKHPVVGVTWYGALAYCKWVNRRLPTEAEWEIACSGGLESPFYPTGESIEKNQANFFSSDTTSVMSYPPNGLGCYDMAGNVYEWCQDWYDTGYYERTASEPDNPKGPLQGSYRVLRGGCWKSLEGDLRTAKRHCNNPGVANGTYGFRTASDAQKPIAYAHSGVV